MADRSEGRRAIFAGALVITVGLAIGILCLAPDPVLRKPTGQPQLVSIEELPDYGEICMPEPADLQTAGINNNLFFAFEQTTYAAAQGAATGDVARPPVRQNWDTDPIYVSINVNTATDEVVLHDTNEYGLRIFKRLYNTPLTLTSLQQKKIIQ